MQRISGTPPLLTAVAAGRPMDPAATGEHRRQQASHVVIPWLIRLRWMSLAALVAAAGAATVWGVRLPALPLGALLAAMAGTNAALALELRAPAPRRGVMGAALLLDAGLLTGVLYIVGGPFNPFAIVYLVGITMAAVTLGHRWAVTLSIGSSLAYALTFVYYRPLEFNDPAASSGILALHLYGMWMALAAAGGLIAYFVGRIAGALEERERELTASRAATARSERLAALFALGAGAAHELATPLSTIRTAAIELERTLAGQSATASDITDYVSVMRREVDRCTTVLDGLSGRAPASGTERHVSLAALIADVKARLAEGQAQRLDVGLPADPQPIAAPAEPLCQVLVALVRNAFDASAPGQRVTLRVEQHPVFRAEITDRGRGMAPEESARADEPFFTTKPKGAGLGLGLFLARTFADQMGGTLRWRSGVGEGTSVTLELPA